MSWQPSVCMAMTRRFRFWPKARPTPPDVGSMAAMTNHSAEPRRQPRYFITRAIAKTSIRGAIWPGIVGSSRLMPSMDIASSMCPTEIPDDSSRQHAGFTPDVRSSRWPISMKTHVEEPPAIRKSRSRRLRLKSCAASMRCSRSSAPSTAKRPMNAELFANH